MEDNLPSHHGRHTVTSASHTSHPTPPGPTTPKSARKDDNSTVAERTTHTGGGEAERKGMKQRALEAEMMEEMEDWNVRITLQGQQGLGCSICKVRHHV